jgi:hypothetical protein
MTTRVLAALLVATLAACGPSARPVDPPAASAGAPPEPAASAATSSPTTPTPTSTATATPAPATPATPPPAVRSALAREPSGTTALSVTAETVVDPAATFDIELAPRLPDARLVLVDPADAHVAAKDVREVAATTRFTLAPLAPLVPGSRYLLRVDGAAVREMHDADGHAFAPIGFPILVAGTPPPPEPKPAPRKRRR